MNSRHFLKKCLVFIISDMNLSGYIRLQIAFMQLKVSPNLALALHKSS